MSGIFLPGIISIQVASVLFGIFSVLFVTISYLRAKSKVKFLNPGVIGLTIVLMMGYIQVYYQTDSNNQDHIINTKDTIDFYVATIVSQPQEKENSWKAEAKVGLVQFKGKECEEKSGNVMLYFSKKDFESTFQYGDKLFLKGCPTLLKPPANPGEFDYKRFLAFRKIYHQHFLRKESVQLVSNEPPSLIIKYSIRARIWADQMLEKNIDGLREQSTASALVLGLMDGLDNELIGAYAATGSLHVLSVSGLHVGIIYWLMLLVLKPLTKTTSGKWTLAILSIMVLWIYAFVTGLSPSVLRAVTMFSFVAIAKPWNQRTNIYNTLAISAFCLLFYEPYLIMSVGFQLSYLAVIGIVYFQPYLSRLWEPKRWLWNNIWQITCVSIAAQVATFSLGLLYFHQFPVYFLLSNLIVIPISFVVLIVGILLIAIGPLTSVATIVGFVLTWFVKLLNGSVIEMEKLPFSLIDSVNITTFQCWLLMAVIISMILLFEYRAYRAAVAASLCVVMFSVIHWNNFSNESDETKLTVYSVNGHSAFDIIEDGQAYFFSDSLLVSDPNKIQYHIQPHRLQCGVQTVLLNKEAEFVRDFIGCRLIVWHEITILQIHDSKFQLPGSFLPDYIVLGNNSIKSLADISQFKSSLLILDSSNSVYFANRILKEAPRSAMNVYSVLHQGAFIAKLK